MFVIICYDIGNDRNRGKVSKFLLDYGRRVQKSVFEADLDEGRLLKIQAEITKLIDPTSDSVRYYYLCARCRPRTDVFGGGPLSFEEEDPTVIV